jgi:hypothetical protein
MTRARVAWAAAAVAATALAVASAPGAQAVAASGVKPVLSFSGTGTAQSIVTQVSFKSGYGGAYYVRYDVYRSSSSKKTSPVKVTVTTISQVFPSTVRGLTYATTKTSKSCPATSARTTYYYWLQGTVSDGGTGVVSFNGTAVAKAACLSIL